MTANTEANRLGVWQIRNETDGVDLPANAVSIGRATDAASSAAAPSFTPLHMLRRYTVNSLATRTFRLRLSAVSANVEVQTQAGQATAMMLLRKSGNER